ncbi:S9 family peptidase [Chromobacterium vaccinii]|uniref:S9 family peptidase n=1 Tax=Chromobacterium vaccinii TaxID=1108595 RepID=UPI001E555FBE|nr:S9 family peptidase [Chromobacterium vaccinii]MCD4500270.1 S9 family peptidase [Chromobacterium vaccinii]
MNPILSFAALAGFCLCAALARADAPPRAETRPQTLSAHGDARVDPYAWLRDDSRSRPEVLAHLQAENRYAETLLAGQQPLRDTLLAEMQARGAGGEASLPYRENGWEYRERYPEGAQQPVYERRPLAGGEWRTVLDAAERAKGKRYYRLGGWQLSPDGRHLAVAEDVRGDGTQQLALRDLANGEWLPLADRKAGTEMVWSADGRALWYVGVDPETYRPSRVYRHTIGGKEDALVFEEKDEAFTVSLSSSASRRYALIAVAGSDSSEAWLLDARDPAAPAKRFAARRPGREYYLDHYRGAFYLRANPDPAGFGLYRSAAPGNDWRALIAPDANSEVESFLLLKRHLIVKERHDGLSRVRAIAWQGGESRMLPLPDPAYRVWFDRNPDPDSGRLRYRYSSLTTPTSTWEWNLANGRTRALWQPKLAGYRAADYRSERLWIRARDGERVPVSLVYRRDKLAKGGNPLLLYGYGAYGMAMDAAFSAPRVSLLDRGFVFAIAHVRGGGELGRRWHEAGRLKNKQNSFNDFVDAARELARRGYARPGQLYAMGGSAGGLLIGAALNQAPGLFRGAVAQVPFVDALSSMQDPSLPLTVGEYGEWGNPADADAYRRLRGYSPVDNVGAGPYPHLLVTAGLNDRQVPYWEPAKWVARLRERQWPGQQLALITEMEAGHRGQSGRVSRLAANAREYAFLLTLSGWREP